MASYENNDYTDVVGNLVSMFGHVVTEEVISTIVESCEGDLNLSMDAIMKLTNDGNTMLPKQNEEDISSRDDTTNPVGSLQQSGSSISYAAQCAQNRGAVPKKTQKINSPSPSSILSHTIQRPCTSILWTDQIRQIITNHNKGARILIFMRGLPGSGKSHLAMSLMENLVTENSKSHIFSTDDYFMVRGRYHYDLQKLHFAHRWNQERVKRACTQGLSPIIVDNTNIEIWEMQPYLLDGLQNGYIIEVIEMNTPWAKKPNQLFRKNKHGVPLITIKKKLANYSEGMTGDCLIRSYGLSYPLNMIPPVKRVLPPLDVEQVSSQKPVIAPAASNSDIDLLGVEVLQLSDSAENIQMPQMTDTIYPNQPIDEKDLSNSFEAPLPSIEESNRQGMPEDINDLVEEDQTKQKFLLEAQKRLEEIEKFEDEWENGEKWEEQTANTTMASSEPNTIVTSPIPAPVIASRNIGTENIKTPVHLLIANLEPKPPRKENNVVEQDYDSKGFMPSVTEYRDWRNIFMPPWVTPEEATSIVPEKINTIETMNNSTSVENGDTNLSGNYKIITTNPRDINEFYIAPEREKIPEKRMLDKSSMTNEGILMSFHCPQRERHFIVFRKLFKHIERESLRDIFDNCCGDANWAVESILGGGARYTLKSSDDKNESDLEEEADSSDELTCTCLANYNIVPDVYRSDAQQTLPELKTAEAIATSSVSHVEKKKRDIAVSDDKIKLKRQIEQNVVISDNYYSAHCLKIRKLRRGENKTEDISGEPSTSGTDEISEIASTQNSNNTTDDISDDDDLDEDDDNSYIEVPDKILNVNIGKTFVKQLDEMFGRKDMEYPENIAFNISIPNYLLNELNALWMESLMFQLDENAKNLAELIKKDEEFARQIALKETELMLAGKEPEVPDLKEIMDLELATSIYLKDMSQWRNKIPTDLAAKMTHEKLFNLFPEVEKDILLEMLMAHDNNFKATVEVLLMSMGRNDLLENENGLNKFIMDKELERNEKILEEQRKEMLNFEWPPLGEEADMETVQGYRDEATQHQKHTNRSKQKAEEYIRRGMPQVATYYSDIANFHKAKQEHADSLAVVSLMQYHSKNKTDSETVDLHYYRVREAKEAMDLFIDSHIRKIRETNKHDIVLFFITGRGLHSTGGPKVKPACMKRLRERGLRYIECNPGLLRARVTCNDKLTFQVT